MHVRHTGTPFAPRVRSVSLHMSATRGMTLPHNHDHGPVCPDSDPLGFLGNPQRNVLTCEFTRSNFLCHSFTLTSLDHVRSQRAISVMFHRTPREGGKGGTTEQGSPPVHLKTDGRPGGPEHSRAVLRRAAMRATTTGGQSSGDGAQRPSRRSSRHLGATTIKAPVLNRVRAAHAHLERTRRNAVPARDGRSYVGSSVPSLVMWAGAYQR